MSFKTLLVSLFLAHHFASAQDAPTQLHKLLASDGAASDGFGGSVALFGDQALIGASDHANSSGAAYLFALSTGAQVVKLTPDDGSPTDWFGGRLALLENTALISAVGDDDQGFLSGSAYLFDSTTGQQRFKLLANDGRADQLFGDSVALTPNWALVGAPHFLAGSPAGSVYVYDVNNGQQVRKLVAQDGVGENFFGSSLATSDNLAVIGAPGDDDNGELSGSAYIFDVTTGSQLLKLKPSDGSPESWFGISVSISGNRALVGTLRSSSQNGSAYLFDITSGQQLFKFTANSGNEGDRFGGTLHLMGNLAFISDLEDDELSTNAGSVYVFDATTGEQLTKFSALDTAARDFFGVSIVAAEQTLLIGAIGDDDNGDFSGSAYVFELPDYSSEPTELTLSNSSILETMESQVEVGSFSIVDADTPSGHVLTLVSGLGDSDNSRFEILNSGAPTPTLRQRSHSISNNNKPSRSAFESRTPREISWKKFSPSPSPMIEPKMPITMDSLKRRKKTSTTPPT